MNVSDIYIYIYIFTSLIIPLIGNIYLVYKWYSPCQLGDYMLPTTFQGNQETPLSGGCIWDHHWAILLMEEIRLTSWYSRYLITYRVSYMIYMSGG